MNKTSAQTLKAQKMKKGKNNTFGMISSRSVDATITENNHLKHTPKFRKSYKPQRYFNMMSA